MTKIIVAELLLRKRWVIGAMLVTLIGCLVYFAFHVPMYRSTIEVYVKGEAIELMDDSPFNKTPEHLTLLFHSATSTAMFDRLIEQFDLHRRSDVPDTGRAGRSVLYAMLTGRVKAQITKVNSVAITVHDHDRATAADMANAIHEGLKEIYADEDEAELEHTMRIYQVMIDSTDGLATRKSKELYELAADIASLQKGSNMPIEAGRELLAMEHQLLSAASQLATSTEDLFHDRRKAGMLLALSKGNGSSAIRLKTSASEDMELDPYLKIAGLTVMITLFVGLAVIAMILIPIDHRLRMEPVANAPDRGLSDP